MIEQEAFFVGGLNLVAGQHFFSGGDFQLGWICGGVDLMAGGVFRLSCQCKEVVPRGGQYFRTLLVPNALIGAGYEKQPDLSIGPFRLVHAVI